jgi:hypothetical protein
MEIVQSANHFGNAFAECKSNKWMTVNLDMESETQ